MAEHLASIFGTEKDRVNCPFYFKIGACRHGDRCSRLHNRPTLSPTLLLKNLYQNPLINPPLGADGRPVPFDRKRVQEFFEDFYEDIFLELAKSGAVEEFVVCDNVADHMAGNCYARFSDEQGAKRALESLAGRYYGGRPIAVEFSPVTDFREATCRQYEEGTCARGGYCNFMHVRPIGRDLSVSLFGDERAYRPALPAPQEARGFGGGGGRGRDRYGGGGDRYDRGGWGRHGGGGGQRYGGRGGGGFRDRYDGNGGGGGFRNRYDGGGSRDRYDGGGFRDRYDGGGSRDRYDGGGFRDRYDGGGSRDRYDGDLRDRHDDRAPYGGRDLRGPGGREGGGYDARDDGDARGGRGRYDDQGPGGWGRGRDPDRSRGGGGSPPRDSSAERRARIAAWNDEEDGAGDYAGGAPQPPPPPPNNL